VAKGRVERRLAAILCADVAGYSRLMGQDEEGTLAALKTHRRELIDPLIAQHQGRIAKTTGDGMLVEFVSIVYAVRCAIVVQQGMKDRNATVAEDNASAFARASISATLLLSPSSAITYILGSVIVGWSGQAARKLCGRPDCRSSAIPGRLRCQQRQHISLHALHRGTNASSTP
jgi:hypothetical protein